MAHKSPLSVSLQNPLSVSIVLTGIAFVNTIWKKLFPGGAL